MIEAIVRPRREIHPLSCYIPHSQNLDTIQVSAGNLSKTSVGKMKLRVGAGSVNRESRGLHCSAQMQIANNSVLWKYIYQYYDGNS